VRKGLDYSSTPSFRFRGGYNRAVRAPNITYPQVYDTLGRFVFANLKIDF